MSAVQSSALGYNIVMCWTFILIDHTWWMVVMPCHYNLVCIIAYPSDDKKYFVFRRKLPSVQTFSQNESCACSSIRTWK